MEFHIQLRDGTDFDVFLDDAISKVEELGSFCGGGGKDKTLSIILFLGKGRGAPDDRSVEFKRWLVGREDVSSFHHGDPLDMWHGPWPEEQSEGAADPEGGHNHSTTTAVP